MFKVGTSSSTDQYIGGTGDVLIPRRLPPCSPQQSSCLCPRAGLQRRGCAPGDVAWERPLEPAGVGGDMRSLAVAVVISAKEDVKCAYQLLTRVQQISPDQSVHIGVPCLPSSRSSGPSAAQQCRHRCAENKTKD